MKSVKAALLASLIVFALPASAALADGMAAPMVAAKPAEKPQFHYLEASEFLPQRIIAQPAVRGSDAEALELARVKALIAAATPDRLAQANWDSDHEDPSAFNAVMGRDLATLPATWSLLIAVQDEADAVVDGAKDAFGRMRPFGVDPTLPTCAGTDPAKSGRGYPSGHAVMGYAVGWALAKLAPEMAPGILARADDYALSRELCAAHFHTDLEASHVLGTLVADRLLHDPRLADKVAAARAELAGR